VQIVVGEDEPYLAEAIRDGPRLDAIAAATASDSDAALKLVAVDQYSIAAEGGIVRAQALLAEPGRVRGIRANASANPGSSPEGPASATSSTQDQTAGPTEQSRG
jgi:hypothetical protein